MTQPSRARSKASLPRTASLIACFISFAATPALASGVMLVRSSDLPMYVEAVRAFRASYRNPVHEISLAGLDSEAAEHELRGRAPEVVVAIGLRAAVLVHDRLPRTPMVYALVPAPEHHDLVGSWVTGIAADIVPSVELGALRSLVPDVRRVGVLVGPGGQDWARAAEGAARRMGLELEIEPIARLDDVGPGVRELLQRVDALWMPADPTTASPEVFRFLLEQSVAHRLPLFAFAPGLVRAGALAAAVPDLDWVGARIAESVRRVQSGERAGDVPATDVRRVRLIANLATARAIGRSLPAGALSHVEVVP